MIPTRPYTGQGSTVAILPGDLERVRAWADELAGDGQARVVEGFASSLGPDLLDRDIKAAEDRAARALIILAYLKALRTDREEI